MTRRDLRDFLTMVAMVAAACGVAVFAVSDARWIEGSLSARVIGSLACTVAFLALGAYLLREGGDQ